MPKRRFRAKDIGAELLPIITKGLYRDPLDTLREYIQNGIDANAKQVDLVVTSDLVSVRDDGIGMTPPVAEKALRLAMSEKDPTSDVGFRGIGIYSAYNVCDRLELFTRPAEGPASRLVFDFRGIRELLEKEEANRIAGNPSSLALDRLLSESVWREESAQCPIKKHGTLVIMQGIRPEVYRRLTDRAEVTAYLQAVAPLPFSRRFWCKDAIEARFAKRDYRIVKLILSINDQREQLFRPYDSSIFEHEKGMGPRFFDVDHAFGKGQLGFAWACLNDARKYLRQKTIRGLLVKKSGFSVGDRNHFARFFSRAVFNNRVTGEIIVTHKDLIPNAARTEFEPGPLRDSLYVAFSRLASQISTWADAVQQELKAQEELDLIAPTVFRILREISECERDIALLLAHNTRLDSYGRTLRSHKRALNRLCPGRLTKTLNAMAQAKATIAKVLSSKQPSARGRPARISRADKIRATAPEPAELTHAPDAPKSLSEVLAALDIETSREVQMVLDYIESEVLRHKLSDSEFPDFIKGLVEYLEESL